MFVDELGRDNAPDNFLSDCVGKNGWCERDLKRRPRRVRENRLFVVGRNAQINYRYCCLLLPKPGSFLIVVIFLSIAGNVLVCMAIYTDRGLRRIGNLFLASLAIADLFVGALVMTFALVNDLQGYWMFGAKFCDIWIAIDVMCSTASILNLCAISLDRYIHIKDPLRFVPRPPIGRQMYRCPYISRNRRIALSISTHVPISRHSFWHGSLYAFGIVRSFRGLITIPSLCAHRIP